MLLTIDIGNTHMVIGGFSGDNLEFTSRISTNPTMTEAECATQIKNTVSLYNAGNEKVDGAIISSVVPQLTQTAIEAIEMIYGVRAITVEPGIKTGINIRTDNPSQVGSDMICASVGAKSICKDAKLIIDMGTATKIMLVDENDSFLGVSIAAGLQLSLRALAGGTAQLPQIGLDAPKRVMGKNTEDCMKSGAVFGHAAMIDGMIDRAEEEFGRKTVHIATGGYAKAIIPHCKHEITCYNELILKGLKIIYDKNK